MGRFVNSKGQAINLAQTSGHARLVLTQVKKYNEPKEMTYLELDECDDNHNLH